MKIKKNNYLKLLLIDKKSFIFLFFIAFLFHSQSFSQTLKQKERNVKAFAELYGYVRFFHPSDEAQKIYWNLFALYGIDKVLNAENDKILIKNLKEIFVPIAPSIYIGNSLPNKNLILSSLVPKETNAYKMVTWINKGLSLPGGSNAYSSLRLNRDKLETNYTEYPLATVEVKDFKGKNFTLSVDLKRDSTDCIEDTLFVKTHDNKDYLKNKSSINILTKNLKNFEFYGKINNTQEIANLILRVPKRRRLEIKNPKVIFNYDNIQKEIRLNQPPQKMIDSNNILNIYLNISEEAEVFKEDKRSISNIIYSQPVSGIYCAVPKTLFANSNFTYPKGDSTNLNDLNTKIISFWKDKSKSHGLNSRLGNVVVVWSILKYAYPYWEDASADKESVFHSLFTKAIIDKTNKEFLTTLRLILAKMNDGHIGVSYSGPDHDNEKTLPLVLEKIGDEIIVKQVLDTNLNKITIGATIESINDQSALKVYNSKYNLISGSPQWRRYKSLLGLFDGIHDSIRLEFKRDSLKQIINTKKLIPALEYRPIALSGFVPKDGLISDSIYYFNLTGDSVVKKMNSLLVNLATAKAIIFDMRGYPTENINSVLGHLLKCTEHTKWMHIPLIQNTTGQNLNISTGWDIAPVKPFFNGKIFFLSDACAQSYSESILGYVKGLKLGTIIGRPSSGSNGDIQTIALVDDFRVFFTGTKVTNINGTKSHFVGIVPDIIVNPTKMGVLMGRDEILEKALELAK